MSDAKLSAALPKMMIAFLVRRCEVELGRRPDAVAFAHWANHQGTPPNGYCLFGRRISEQEARVIIGQQARLVSAKSAAPHEQHHETDDAAAPAAAGVVSLADVRARRRASGRARVGASTSRRRTLST